MATRITNAIATPFFVYGGIVAGNAALDSFTGGESATVEEAVRDTAGALVDAPGAVSEAADGLEGTDERDSNVLLGLGWSAISVTGFGLAFKGGRGAFVDPKKGL